MTLEQTEFQNFPLIWRFTDAVKYTQLTPAEFKRFQPLTEEQSLRFWEQYVYPSSAPDKRHLVQLSVQHDITLHKTPSFRSRSKDEENAVIPNLRRIIPSNNSSEILFFWHGELCVRTYWDLFLAHWDDFCYPSDDSNILVFPDTDKAVAYIEESWFILNRTKGEPVFPLLPDNKRNQG